jgi:heme/copper-type cytochrome/quinol oxidase subunit 4
MILDMVNQNVQETLKKFQDSKNRESEKAKEEIKSTSYVLFALSIFFTIVGLLFAGKVCLPG